MNTLRTIDDHRIFRLILAGMSHPGKVYDVQEFFGKRTAAAELLRCLLDQEVSFAVIGDPGLETALAHSGCRQVAAEEADYIVVGKGSSSGTLAHYKKGSLEFPDNSATILYLVEKLNEGNGEIVLTGPGVNGSVSLGIVGLGTDALLQLREANSEFPLGVDAIFLDRHGCIACIPRSSRIGAN
jgi:alpha-D-ribose 1-methylphosphonate 5-triphosphate synthase subunit PhnH